MIVGWEIVEGEGDDGDVVGEGEGEGEGGEAEEGGVGGGFGRVARDFDAWERRDSVGLKDLIVLELLAKIERG